MSRDAFEGISLQRWIAGAAENVSFIMLVEWSRAHV